MRCCWDPCHPTSSFCQSTRPTRTSSRGGGKGHLRAQRGLLLREQTINFILLKPRPFCHPEASPSRSGQLCLDTGPSLSPLGSLFFLIRESPRPSPWAQPCATRRCRPERLKPQGRHKGSRGGGLGLRGFGPGGLPGGRRSGAVQSIAGGSTWESGVCPAVCEACLWPSPPQPLTPESRPVGGPQPGTRCPE